MMRSESLTQTLYGEIIRPWQIPELSTEESIWLDELLREYK